MKFHSIVDVITNSSSVAYIIPRNNWEERVKDFFNNIYKDAGLNINIDDVYDFYLEIEEDYVEMLLDYLEKEDEDEDEDSCYDGKRSSTRQIEKEIANKFLIEENINWDTTPYPEQKILLKKLQGILSKALQNGEIVLDGYDGGDFSDSRFYNIIMKSKITGEARGLGSEMLKIFEMESGNDNY